MRALVVALTVGLATPAVADSTLGDFLGTHGCTLGPEAREAAVQAGFDAQGIDAARTAWADAGQISQQGAYAVLSPEICTIRLPRIDPVLNLDSPQVQAILRGPGEAREEYIAYLRDQMATADTEAQRAQLQEDIADALANGFDNGCYFEGDISKLFDDVQGGTRGAGEADYLAFLAAHLMTGQVRFYSPSPLRTPPGFQSMRGACGDIPEAADMARSFGEFEDRYRSYIRQMNAGVGCDGQWLAGGPMSITADLQGYDPDIADGQQPPINAWAWFEYDLVAMGNGLYTGIGSGSRPQPRPPMCFVDAPPPW